jgi:hypothetical protein
MGGDDSIGLVGTYDAVPGTVYDRWSADMTGDVVLGEEPAELVWVARKPS